MEIVGTCAVHRIQLNSHFEFCVWLHQRQYCWTPSGPPRPEPNLESGLVLGHKASDRNRIREFDHYTKGEKEPLLTSNPKAKPERWPDGAKNRNIRTTRQFGV